MDWWWSRLLGTAPKKNTSKSQANDPEVRLAKFKRLFHTILSLCNRPRDLSNEAPVLEDLLGCLQRIAIILIEETRAPAPHLSIQYAAANRIYTVITRAATASQNEPVVHATIAVLAALVDCEEEDFLTNAIFAKCLMRLVTRVLDSEFMTLKTQTETNILELLFTITARIRLQPDILRHWFHSTLHLSYDDGLDHEKLNFVGRTQKDDFPLCYLLIDRVHYEGRIGDFARTGLLYIFEATGKSSELEEWMVSSDLPTLMASGLGALYSQLSRELSILHPDATLPAVLAMSDYSTTHPRATAESAFSDRHKSDMATFLSDLAFWQDVLDHSRSADVRHTLLDHFQILFLQQLLYPSLLQSSDTDAGSSVAVLTYMTAIIQTLDFQELMNIILKYLLAIEDDSSAIVDSPVVEMESPRSPITARRRESLLILAAPKDPNDAVGPILFNLTDLILNNVSSRNPQSVYAALQLTSTILTRHKGFAFGTLLKVQPADNKPKRTMGALKAETDEYLALAVSLHDHIGLDDTYTRISDDVRIAVESQTPFEAPRLQIEGETATQSIKSYNLSNRDPLMRALDSLLKNFLTNSVDVNLALSEAVVAIALCMEVRLDSWLAQDPDGYVPGGSYTINARPWAQYVDIEEIDAFSSLQESLKQPVWSNKSAPMLFSTLRVLLAELDLVREKVPDLDHLILVRKTMLEAMNLDGPMTTHTAPASGVNTPARKPFLDVADAQRNSASRSPSRSPSRGRLGDVNATPSSRGVSPAPSPGSGHASRAASPGGILSSIFQPPPPEQPSTTDLLMQSFSFPSAAQDDDVFNDAKAERKATLNHILTNVVILQEFVLELVAVLQARATVLGERELRLF